MLSDRIQLLLSAYVDGALSPKERDAADRLLRESAEARALVEKLGANIRKFKSLARKPLGGEFTGQVIRKLPPAAIVPVAPPVAAPGLPVFEPAELLVRKPRLRRGMPTWAVGGIAATVVGGIVIGGAVWLRGQLEFDPDLLPAGRVHTPVVAVKPAPKQTPKSEPPGTGSSVDQVIGQVVRGAGERSGEGKAEPIVPPEAQPVRFAFGDLKKQNSFDSLKWELSHSSDGPSGVHLDITVKYNARSLNRIIESFSNQGIQLVVTPPAEAGMRANRPLLVYAENIHADQLALALRELGEIDVQGKQREASTFDAVRVAPGSADDHTRIARGLGIEPKQLKLPPGPVSQVSALGVVLAADRPSNPAAVREIRGFLAGRGPVQIGTLQVFIHLQPTGQ